MMPRRHFIALQAVLLFAIAVTAFSGCGGDENGNGSSSKTGPNCVSITDGCSCTIGAPNEFECSAANVPDTECCADSGWPSSGGCACKKPNKSGCTETGTAVAGAVSCACYEGATGAGSECTAPPGGQCCVDTNNPKVCKCYDWGGDFACTDFIGLEQVSSCDGAQYAQACPAGKTEVTSCSNGGGSSGDGDSGDDEELCSPSSGECEDAGDCSCGQSCMATAVCESCSTRCNFPCATDADCVALSAGLTFAYTRCVKTSPNYEIYVCE